MLSAILFDLDGLMVDSEQLARRAWNDLLAPRGVRLSEGDYRPLIGLSHDESIEYVLRMTDLDIPPASLDQVFWDRMMELIEGDLHPMPGLSPLLDHLRAEGIPLGVASNSPAAYVERALDKIMVRAYFACVRGVDQVANPKPAPDLYLAAADCLRVPPEECLAIEDSPSGAQAALAANMVCLMVPSQGGEIEIPEGVAAVFSSLVALHAAIEGIIREF
jgi:HAD superfamily hydrolase (TIGR01509 family)